MQWIASAYLAGLPDDVKQEFATMTVGEIAALDPAGFLPQPAAMRLSVDTQRVIACLNTVVVTKT